ncbi:hypothetical protein TELCIR_22967 [Teladorsagia circumcincta]|uniref:Uncharacterized protein n=1 Tax=Teladorsagia circumcincta TaxID=45464 RepID=A0A2G9TCF8_TELCI|nr:hypothetical protein TELCIR_22967 [Teladorsagia circumcincta]
MRRITGERVNHTGRIRGRDALLRTADRFLTTDCDVLYNFSLLL